MTAKKCPVCYQTELERSNDICEVCGWERDDYIPTDDFYTIDIWLGPNNCPSLDHARKAWKKWRCHNWFLMDEPSDRAWRNHKINKRRLEAQEFRDERESN